MKIAPNNDYVLIQRKEAQTQTDGGLIIPDTAKEKMNRGVVLAVGPGQFLLNGNRAEPLVRTGSVVIFGKHAGTEFEHDGQKGLLLLRDNEILASYEE